MMAVTGSEIMMPTSEDNSELHPTSEPRRRHQAEVRALGSGGGGRDGTAQANMRQTPPDATASDCHDSSPPRRLLDTSIAPAALAWRRTKASSVPTARLWSKIGKNAQPLGSLFDTLPHHLGVVAKRA